MNKLVIIILAATTSLGVMYVSEKKSSATQVTQSNAVAESYLLNPLIKKKFSIKETEVATTKEAETTKEVESSSLVVNKTEEKPVSKPVESQQSTAPQKPATTEQKTESSPTPSPAEKPVPVPEQSFVANLNVAKQTNQIISVVGNGGSRATVSLHLKGQDGLWNQVFSVNGAVGKNGITSNKREGDGKTPSGVYSFGTAFGLASNPGTSLPYRVVTQNDYWIDDSNSAYYNMWVNDLEVTKDWNSAEHLASYPVQYKYAVALNYNTNRVPNKGSAIFLHVAKGSNTAGCVAVPQSTMIQILKTVKSSARIVIAPSMSALKQY